MPSYINNQEKILDVHPNYLEGAVIRNLKLKDPFQPGVRPCYRGHQFSKLKYCHWKRTFMYMFANNIINYYNLSKMASNTIYLSNDLTKVCQRGWCNPNRDFLCNVAFARGDKKEILISEIGENGPIIDLLLRASITQMVVMHFASDSRQIILSKKEGLRKHAKSFSEELVLKEQIAKWFECRKATNDFTIQYRSFRMKLLSSQLFTLLNAPKTLVSNVYTSNKFIILTLL